MTRSGLEAIVMAVMIGTAASVSLSGPSFSAVRVAQREEIQASRGQEEQAPRGQEEQAPRGQEEQAPRGQEEQAPRSTSIA